jgi:transglutaminase-like putative cysteine protease
MVGSYTGDAPLTRQADDRRVPTLRVGCEFIWKAEVRTAAVVQVEPHPDLGYAIASETWSTFPEVVSRLYRDGFGNCCRRLTLPEGGITLRYDAEVTVIGQPDHARVGAREVAAEDLPDETLLFTLPSRFCQSDVLADDAWKLFGGLEPGYGRVQQICDFVHHHLTWQSGTTSSATSAVDVYRSRSGVCRDFAHLAVSFCRALNIPARYAFGYLPDVGVTAQDAPMDFCAWIEVYLEDRWYTFDPRNNARRIGRVLIGRGRDALDVAMITTFGGPELVEMTVWADEFAGPTR